MGKKSLMWAIVISLIAVLGVSIAYVALKDYFMAVKVNSVEFTIDSEYEEYVKENTGTDYEILRFCVDDITTYQLTWNVSPSDAENKNVTFASTNSNFTVSDTGLVSFTKKDESTIITITTVDQQKTDKIKIETYSNKAANASYNYDTNTIAPSDTGDYFIEDTKLYLYNNASYDFILDFDLAFTLNSGETKLSLTNENNVYTVRASNLGETVINVSKENGANKTIAVVVVEKVIGIDVSNENVDEGYLVGNKNGYKLPLSVSTNGATNGDLIYTLTKKQETTPLATGYTVDNNLVASLTDVEEGTYTLVVKAKYDETKSASLTFTVNNAYNVASHADMFTYYNDNHVTAINLVGNYVIELGVNDKAAMKTSTNQDINFLVKGADDNYYLNPTEELVAIYWRTSGITINGNGHTIDASRVQKWEHLTTQLGHSRIKLFGCGDYKKEVANYYSPETSTTVPTYTIRQLLESKPDVLNNEDKLTQRNYVKSLYEMAPKFMFKNIKLIGNISSSTENVYGVGDYTKVVDGTIESYRGLTGLNGFGMNDVDLTLDNVDLGFFLIGINHLNYSADSFALTIKDSHIHDTFGYSVFTNGVAKQVYENSKFSRAGHFAIYNKSINSGLFIDHVTEIDITETDYSTKIVGKLTFDNWLNAVEEGAPTAFITQSGDGAIFPGLVQVASQTLGNKLSDIIKDENGGKWLNAGIMSDCISTDKIVRTNYDFTGINNYNDNHNKDAYWNAMVQIDIYRRTGGQLGMTPTQAYTNIISQQSNVNDDIICVSVNGNQAMNVGVDSNSYFYLGFVDAE